jgi:TRAP-type mannitol/chloroaromatic compound transport system substrate-binding protein
LSVQSSFARETALGACPHRDESSLDATRPLVSQDISGDLLMIRTPARRGFLKGAAVAGAASAGALAAPMVNAQQVITLRFQSTWPAKDIFHEYANDYAKKVNDMSAGRLRIEVLPAGSVVRAFDMLDAVSKGTLDGGHGVLAYWYGKNSAVALWGSGPAFGMDPNMVLAWHQFGGGEALLDKVHAAMNVNVKSFVYGPMPTQPLGWFKKPITKPEDFKGLEVPYGRTVD